MAGPTIFPSIQPQQERNVLTSEGMDPEVQLDRGECPWCDEYEGDHPEQHAPRAHPDEWSEYKDG